MAVWMECHAMHSLQMGYQHVLACYRTAPIEWTKIPDAHRTIVPSRGEPAPIRAERQRINWPGRAFDRPADWLPCARIPEAYRGVEASRCESPAVPAERDRLHPVGVAQKGRRHLRPGETVPYSDRIVLAG